MSKKRGRQFYLAFFRKKEIEVPGCILKSDIALERYYDLHVGDERRGKESELDKEARRMIMRGSENKNID